MDLKREITRKRFEGALDAAIRNTETILTAHIDLGIPLEDAICAVVRKALTVPAAEAGRQLNLIFSSPEPTQPNARAS